MPQDDNILSFGAEAVDDVAEVRCVVCQGGCWGGWAPVCGGEVADYSGEAVGRKVCDELVVEVGGGELTFSISSDRFERITND